MTNPETDPPSLRDREWEESFKFIGFGRKEENLIPK
jgi:hypothetical protein